MKLTTFITRSLGLAVIITLLLVATLRQSFAAPSAQEGEIFLPIVRSSGAQTVTATPITPTPITPTPVTPTPVTPTPITPTPTLDIKPPLSVKVSLDATTAITAEIGTEGGWLTTTHQGVQFALYIPPTALDYAEVITMTPVNQIDAFPLSGGFAGAVSLAPDGLQLYEYATIWITPTQPITGELTVGFAYETGGAEFYLRRLGVGAGLQAAQRGATGGLTQKLDHLAGYGAAAASRAEVAQQQQHVPTDPLAQVEQSSIDLEVPMPTGYNLGLFEERVAKAVNDGRYIDEAIRHHMHLRENSAEDLVDNPEYLARFDRAVGQLSGAIIAAGGASAQRCRQEKKPEEGFRLLRWANYVRKQGMRAIATDLEEKLRNCLTFKLVFHSDITEGGFGDPYGYHYQLVAEMTLRAATGTRATGSTPLNWTILEWIGRPWEECTLSVAGTGSTLDMQSGNFGLSMRPVSRTSPAVYLTLRYDPGVPAEKTTIQCPGGGGTTRNTNGWYIYFDQTHQYERLLTAGYQVTTQVVGAGSFPGWTYHQTASGPSGQAVIEQTTITLEHTPLP